MTLETINTDLLDALRAKQSKKGQFDNELAELINDGKVGEAIVHSIGEKTMQNAVSGFLRAAKKLKVEDRVEILRDHDNKRVLVFKHA